jgi:hypothetical protein
MMFHLYVHTRVRIDYFHWDIPRMEEQSNCLHTWLEFGLGGWASYCNILGNIISRFITEGEIRGYWIIISI